MNQNHRPSSSLAALAYLDSCPRFWHIGLSGVNQFVEIAKRHWKAIGDKLVLPERISTALCAYFTLAENDLQELWTILLPVVAQQVDEGEPLSVDDICRKYAPQLATEILWPPVSHCITPECKGQPLGSESVIEARMYTLHRGVLQISSKSAYCNLCNTRYFSDYCVTKAKNVNAFRRYYSPHLKPVLHVHESAYVEADLCKYFERQFVNTHTSSANLARVYNEALRQSTHLAQHVSLLQEITPDIVLDSFFLHALWRDKEARGEALELPHHGLQRTRYDQALDERNYRMAGTGQEMWAHACERCTKFWTDDDGHPRYMSGCVTDGVTLGHPCCSVADCLERLANVMDRFCPTHSELAKQCSVNGCTLPAEKNHITCVTASHRQWESTTDARKNTKADKERAKRAKRAGTQLEPEVDPSSSQERITGRRHRRWTHNEQLMVRCCGIIISRATFYGSEGVSGVKDFIKVTFPPCYPSSLASYVFYDNACRLLAHIRASHDHYFDDCGIPVDAFHAACHHVGDALCQQFCIPDMFPELRDEHGKWIFNSSAAEQTNVWFGAFQSMVREMPAPRYTFFLDEMIALRNRSTTENLAKQGHHPHLIPEESLRQSRVM